MDEIVGIPLDVATPAALGLSVIALIVMSFVRGWIMSRFTVEQLLTVHRLISDQANLRADFNWKLYETERHRGDVLEKILDDLSVVGETQVRILNALPKPTMGKDSEKVN